MLLQSFRQQVAAAESADSASASAPVRVKKAKIKSAATFAIAAEQVTEVLTEGSSARTEFETSFKQAMANTIGGGGVFEAADILISSIQAGSVNVDWEVEAPEEIMTDVADLVQTVGDDASDIQVTVGGVSVPAAQIDAPEVLVEPDVDCAGEWLPCDVACKSYYEITQVASGGATSRAAGESIAD
eukprot:SAG31_NODE_3827_length_3846_cov_69.025354_2_plen_186_part_00